MNCYIPFAIICILACYLFRNADRKCEKLFFITFLFACFFAAIRYEFGPDYVNYLDGFEILKLGGSSCFIDGHSEWLFVKYMNVFPLYSLFIAFNSFLWFGAYYFFFRIYAKSNYYWFLLLFFFFDVNCILNNLIAMRQAMGAFLFIIAFFALKEQKRILFVLLILLCSLFHTSCLALLPIVFITNKTKSFIFSKHYLFIIILLGIIVVFIGRNSIISLLSTWLIDNVEKFQRYSPYLDDMTMSSNGIIAKIKFIILQILSIIPFIFLFNNAKKETIDDYIIIYKLGLITSSLIILFGGGIMSRFYMILNPFYIVALIQAFKNSINSKQNILVMFVVAFLSIYTFYYYLQADYCESFLTYNTIFSAPYIP